MSINGISDELGLTILGGEEAQTKVKLMEISSKTFVLSDHSKIGRNSLKFVAKLSDIEAIVTDENVDKAAARKLQENGVNLLISPYMESES